jgi:serine protease Do
MNRKNLDFGRVRVGLILCASVFWWALSQAATPHATAPVDVRRDATVAAIEMVIPCVVNIATETLIQRNDWYETIFRGFYGWRPRQERLLNLGSGVIIDEEGYILTNFHVINRADRVQVKLWDGRDYDADRIVATPASDVALLKIRAKPGERFKAIKLATDDDLLLGETVLALGNPFGLGGTVTRGILSSKNRRPATGNEPLNVEDWLQTDAAINPGNSGGPLVNLKGELIGLNVAVHRDQEGERGAGIGFSIPVRQVALSLSRFFSPEVTDSVWFGAQLRPGTQPLVITGVQPGSPAAQAGIKEGDRVLRINGREPAGLVDFNRTLGESKGKPVRLSLQRGREPLQATVRLRPFDDLIREKLGMTVLEPSAQTASRFGMNMGEGLFVDSVEQGGPAGNSGLDRGYLLITIDGRPATDLRTVGEVLSAKAKGESVRLTVVVPRRLGGSYVEFRQGVVDVKVR